MEICRGGDKPSAAYKAAYWTIRAANTISRSKITSSGLSNLPNDEPFILAYTHHNSFDVPAIGSVIYEQTKRPVYFMAKEELLGKAIIGSLLRSMHGIPIRRGGIQEISQMRIPIDALKQGHILALAPEGGRVNGDKVAETLGGVGFIAIRTSVGVIPVGVAGVNHRRTYLPRSIHLHFGESLDGSTRQAVDSQIHPALQAALNTAYSEYALVHGDQAAANLDRGLTKLF